MKIAALNIVIALCFSFAGYSQNFNNNYNALASTSISHVEKGYSSNLKKALDVYKDNVDEEVENDKDLSAESKILVLKRLHKFKVNAHPIPTANFINLKVKDIITEVVVYTLKGQEVLRESINKSEVSVNLETLKNAVYLIHMSTEKKEQVIKVVKQ